ncbi:putative transposase [Oscillibacter valericigenes Sjm18-20]|nr:putative transposase [Oscillibacter valericigenes Sjm18-20]
MSSAKMLALESVRVLYMIDKILVSILAQMRDLASGLKEYDTGMSMPGAGNILSPRLISEIEDVRRFHSSSALVAYAGLDAPPFQSETFTGTNRHISKRGSSCLRKTGYEVKCFLKHVKPARDTAVYDFLLEKEAEGKPPRVAKIATLNIGKDHWRQCHNGHKSLSGSREAGINHGNGWKGDIYHVRSGQKSRAD